MKLYLRLGFFFPEGVKAALMTFLNFPMSAFSSSFFSRSSSFFVLADTPTPIE